MSASELELDMYSELANIGIGTAATALGQMLTHRVTMTSPEAVELTLGDVEAFFTLDQADVALVLVSAGGELAGQVCLVLEDPGAYLASLGVPHEFAESALAEIGNIFGSQFLAAVGSMAGLSSDPEPPAVALAPRSAVVQTVVAIAAQTEPFFVIRSRLLDEETGAASELIYMPEHSTIESLRELLDS